MTKCFRSRRILSVLLCDNAGRTNEPVLIEDTPDIRMTGTSVYVFFYLQAGSLTAISTALQVIVARVACLGPRNCCVLHMAVSLYVSHYARTAIEIVPHWRPEPPGVVYSKYWKETLFSVS